jgi:ketosteroid isomerase-like protein
MSTESVRAIIERHNAHAEKCYGKGDVNALLSIFTADAWQLPPHMPALVGHEAIRTFWLQAFASGTWEFRLRTQAVEVQGALAVERGVYEVRFTASANAPMPSFEDRGNYLVHWRQEPDGEWRVAADAPVSELPL